MKDLKTYYYKEMPNPNLGIDIFLAEKFTKGTKFKAHWHENMQLYFFTEGKALVECNKKHYSVTTDSIIVINSNELHSLESLSNDLKFYTIRIDSSFFLVIKLIYAKQNFLHHFLKIKYLFKI